MDITYWSIHSFSRSGGYGVKRVVMGGSYHSQLQVSLIRVHDYLVEYPSNNKSILDHGKKTK